MPHQDLFVDGVRYPSVTEILGDAPKPWLDKWRAKWGVLADRKMRAAANIGTEFHMYAELVATQSLPIYGIVVSPRIYIMVGRFVEWMEMSGFKAKETELHVVSNEYKYQGTFDATGYLADKPKELCLFDWKTSSGIYPEYAEQLAAYAQAYFEQTGIKIKRGIIVHISKDKPFSKITVKEYRLNVPLMNKFLKRLKNYNEARGV